jgi:hypothetical protein
MSDLVERLRKLTGDVPPRGHVVLAEEAAARIEQLEAALREIKQLALSCKPAETPAALAHMVRICIDAALSQSSPPKREENSDVSPGFRGNNDNA